MKTQLNAVVIGVQKFIAGRKATGTRAGVAVVAVALCSMLGVARAADLPTKKTQQVQAAVAGSAPNSGTSAGPLPAGTIARVNGVAITQGQLDQAVTATKAPDTPALRATLKNELIARELFRQAAEQAHYASHADVQAALDQVRTNLIVQAYLRDQIKPAPVTDADVKAEYDRVVGSLGENEYQPSVIEVKDADTAQKIIDQLKKGGDFAALAKQYSTGPDAAQGGRLGWISFKTPIQPGQTQNWPQPLAEALVKLPQGAVSAQPVQVDSAYWIVRVDQKRPTQIPQFDQVKDTLRKRLEQVAATKATTALVGGLLHNAHIQQ
jgi:peptidyl-prolyl cis-trans isomerase C